MRVGGIMIFVRKLSIFILALATPFAVHGFGVWQCAGMLLPELNPLCWDVCGFDFETELLLMNRENVSRKRDFTSLGIQGPIKLSSKKLDFGWEWGYRISGRAKLTGGKSVEVSWLNPGKWSDSKIVKSESNDLYSIYSDFGLSPPGGFVDTDQASSHKIDYDSRLDSIEVSVRRHWRILKGAFLYGYRYVSIDEEFQYQTIGIDGELETKIDSKNRMHGMQAGLEFAIPCTACYSIEVFGKGGMYANCSEQSTVIKASSLTDPLKEKKDKGRGSWGMEGGFKVVYELCPNMLLSAGYQYLYFENIALAIENFSSQSPYGDEQDKISLENDGHLTYHGITLGINFCW
jgi:hypothetical protein